MAYRKPAWFTRAVFNKLAMRFEISGAKEVAVRRRSSGGMQRVPLIPIEFDGGHYLVSPRGESDWVKNLRAADGHGELAGKPFTSAEVPVAERAPILEAYQGVAGRAVASHFKALPDPVDHPVFRLQPS